MVFDNHPPRVRRALWCPSSPPLRRMTRWLQTLRNRQSTWDPMCSTQVTKIEVSISNLYRIIWVISRNQMESTSTRLFLLACELLRTSVTTLGVCLCWSSLNETWVDLLGTSCRHRRRWNMSASAVMTVWTANRKACVRLSAMALPEEATFFAAGLSLSVSEGEVLKHCETIPAKHGETRHSI